MNCQTVKCVLIDNVKIFVFQRTVDNGEKKKKKQDQKKNQTMIQKLPNWHRRPKNPGLHFGQWHVIVLDTRQLLK